MTAWVNFELLVVEMRLLHEKESVAAVPTRANAANFLQVSTHSERKLENSDGSTPYTPKTITLQKGAASVLLCYCNTTSKPVENSRTLHPSTSLKPSQTLVKSCVLTDLKLL